MSILKPGLLFFPFSMLIICCNHTQEDNASFNDTTHLISDSSPAGMTHSRDSVFKISDRGSFFFIDSTVACIDQKIKSGVLTKNEEECEDAIGGYVYGYYDGSVLRMLYSQSSGGEFGHDEIKSYFIGDRVVYAEYRFYWIYRKKNGSVESEKMVAQKKYYPEQIDSTRDSLHFIDGIRVPCSGMSFTRADIPSRKTIIENDIKMIANLNRNCK